MNPNEAYLYRGRHVVLDDVPDGYIAARVRGRDLIHLVRPEPFVIHALCGVGANRDSFAEHFYRPQVVCLRCVVTQRQEAWDMGVQR